VSPIGLSCRVSVLAGASSAFRTKASLSIGASVSMQTKAAATRY